MVFCLLLLMLLLDKSEMVNFVRSVFEEDSSYNLLHVAVLVKLNEGPNDGNIF